MLEVAKPKRNAPCRGVVKIRLVALLANLSAGSS